MTPRQTEGQSDFPAFRVLESRIRYHLTVFRATNYETVERGDFLVEFRTVDLALS